MLFAFTLLAVMVCLLGITLLSLPQPQVSFPLEETTINSSDATSQSFSVKEYDEQLEKYLSIASIQPTHRDILINISLLYQAQNNDQKAEQFWIAAKELDPNNPIFLHRDNK